ELELVGELERLEQRADLVQAILPPRPHVETEGELRRREHRARHLGDAHEPASRSASASANASNSSGESVSARASAGLPIDSRALRAGSRLRARASSSERAIDFRR